MNFNIIMIRNKLIILVREGIDNKIISYYLCIKFINKSNIEHGKVITKTF